MIAKKFFIVILLILGTATVSFSDCIPFSYSYPGEISGEIQMDCSICQLEYSCTLEYNNYSSQQDMLLNGHMKIKMTSEYEGSNTLMKITISDGPLSYLIYGEHYDVFFNDLYYEIYSSETSFTIQNVSGGITVNGNYYPGNELLFDYLF